MDFPIWDLGIFTTRPNAFLWISSGIVFPVNVCWGLSWVVSTLILSAHNSLISIQFLQLYYLSVMSAVVSVAFAVGICEYGGLSGDRATIYLVVMLGIGAS